MRQLARKDLAVVSAAAVHAPLTVVSAQLGSGVMVRVGGSRLWPL